MIHFAPVGIALAALGAPTSRDLTAQFDLPPGLEATLWAESPQLHNPTAMDVDVRGRVWVTEAVNYRQWDGRNPGRHHAEGDRVVILEDTDGDGACDSSKVFVQDKDLTSPLGIAVIGDRIYVSCSPNLFVYTDEDGDDRPDKREVFLTGFGGFDHDHGLHSVVAGPDGRLLFNAGNAGPHVVSDRSGWTLRSGSLYNGGGPQIADNKPGLLSDDGRAWTGGLVLRVGYDGAGLEVLAHNFRNNYEVTVDSFGNLYQSDNDDDGNRGCRTLWCMEGGDHGFFSADGTRAWQADRRPGQTTERAHWHQDDPGVVPAGTINGAGGATGVAMYEGALLSHWIDGAVLNADAGANVVYAHTPVPDGAGFEMRPGALIRARVPRGEDSERARWFRPSDVVVGVDGSVYVSDWYDPGVGGHLAGDREAYGRILRIAPEGHRPEVPELDVETLDGQLQALRSPAINVRELGRQRLAEAGDEASSALLGLYGDDIRLRARVLWLLGTLDSMGNVVRAALRDPYPGIRVTALRVLSQTLEPSAWLELVAAEDVARDPSPIVRREVALQLRRVNADSQAAEAAFVETFLTLCEGYDGEDRAYLEALGIAAQGREEALYAEVAAAFGDVPSTWDSQFEGLAWRLHPSASRDAFVVRAMDAGLSVEARRRAIDALAFQGEREAAEAVLTVAQSGPEDLREYALWWVRHRDTNDWQAYRLLEQVEASGFEDAEVIYRSDLVRRGTVSIDVPLGNADTLWLVVTDGGNGNACDWADWIAPRLIGSEGELLLTELGWTEAEAAWGNVNAGRNCVGAPLRIGDQEYETGIGTHASSYVAFALPPGYERFICEAGPDFGGSSQADGAATSIVFEVRVGRPAGPHPTLALLQRMDDGAVPQAERAEAALALARDPRGALHVIRRAAGGELSDELRRDVAVALFENPDVAVRALASEHFSRPGDEDRAAALPPVRELVALEGDARRGRKLFFDERAQCSTCHAVTQGDSVRGSHIGPDLTNIGGKYGSAEIFDAILNPSAGIAFGYDTWLVETTDGRLFSGFLLADGDNLVLKDTQGFRQVIPRDDVAERTKQKLSTMPAGVSLDLSAQELADLVAMLTEAPREPVFGEEVELFNGQDLSGWTHHLAGDGDPTAVWSVEDGVLICRGNPIGYLRTQDDFRDFHLSLEWRFDPAKGPGNSGVLLRMVGEDKVWPKSIEAQLHHRNAGDIWNIGAFGMAVDPARTEGRRTVRLRPSSEHPLGDWNRYDILVHGGRLELRVNGVLQNTADWCDEVAGKICLQSEGAEIHFRNIRLRPILSDR